MKEETIALRISASQLNHWLDKACSEHKSLSAWIRKTCDAAIIADSMDAQIKALHQTAIDSVKGCLR